MTHKAYIEAAGANVTQGDGSIKRVEFELPKRKQIASGSEAFCRGVLEGYQAKHPDTEGGIIETSERGDPWHAQWAKVHSTTDASIGHSSPGHAVIEDTKPPRSVGTEVADEGDCKSCEL